MNLQEKIRRILREDYSPAGKEVIPNEIVVHKSAPYWRENIIETGLQVSVGDCYQVYVGGEIKCKPAIFATNSDNREDWFSSTYDDDVWFIDTTKIPNVKWYEDKHFNFKSNSKHIVTFQNIPSEALTLYYEGSGKSEDLIQESIRKVLREEINNETFNPHNENYLDAWLGVGDEDMESYEDYGIDTIGRIIDGVRKLKFPLRIYRGINTLDKQGKHNLVDDLKYDNVSWSTSRYVAEEFGNVVYTGIVDNIDDINLEYTIYRRILHKPLDENEIVMKDNRLIKNLKRFK